MEGVYGQRRVMEGVYSQRRVMEGVDSQREQAFAPTNQEWRAVQCKRLKFPILMIGSLRHRPHQSSLGIPNSVDTIVGDGNCLYRALSLEITGTQAHHEQEYLVEGGSPLQPKTWGTDVEVLAAATLLQTHVVVYSACRRWLTYKPLFALNDSRLESLSQSVRNEKVYLRNICAHFERVIRVC
ncbi:hypothetical protein ACOMHN_017837 [Nucella lapillus]